ncbi:hypothetical protein CRYUN_Cryun21dG0063600 [Craigia yunnanensis]
MAPSLSYEIEQQPFDQDAILNHNSEGIFLALPPSFTSLLTNCCSTAEQAANQPTVSEEIDLKSQIVVFFQTMSQYCGYHFQHLEDKEDTWKILPSKVTIVSS